MTTTDLPATAPTVPAVLGAVPLGAARRGAQLVVGLLAFTASMAMLMHAGQGAMPWDVLHQGLARATGWSLGVVVAVTSAVVLAAWVPLRQCPGIGTLANVVVIAVTIEPFLRLLDRVLPDPGAVVAVLLALAAIVLNGVATAAYVGVHLGPGPRDGLLTGLTARTGWSVRGVKTGIEVAVVAAGWALGGTLGWATVAFALGVGPVVQVATRWSLLVPSRSLTVTSRRSSVRAVPAVPVCTAAPTVPAVPDGGDGGPTARRAREIARALDVVRDAHGPDARR